MVVISFVNRVPEALFGLDKINAILTLYLAIGPSGSALSLDRWLARAATRERRALRNQRRANFALRLIQVHMCIIYFFAGISKFQGARVVERRRRCGWRSAIWNTNRPT